MLKLTFKIVLMLVIASVVILGCGKPDKTDKASVAAEVITVAQFKTLLDSQEDVLIVDVRDKSEYDVGHIPGAICMTYPDDIESRYKELPADTTIALY